MTLDVVRRNEPLPMSSPGAATVIYCLLREIKHLKRELARCCDERDRLAICIGHEGEHHGEE